MYSVKKYLIYSELSKVSFSIIIIIFLLSDVTRRPYEADVGRCVETCNASDTVTIKALPEVRMVSLRAGPRFINAATRAAKNPETRASELSTPPEACWNFCKPLSRSHAASKPAGFAARVAVLQRPYTLAGLGNGGSTACSHVMATKSNTFPKPYFTLANLNSNFSDHFGLALSYPIRTLERSLNLLCGKFLGNTMSGRN